MHSFLGDYCCSNRPPGTWLHSGPSSVFESETRCATQARRGLLAAGTEAKGCGACAPLTSPLLWQCTRVKTKRPTLRAALLPGLAPTTKPCWMLSASRTKRARLSWWDRGRVAHSLLRQRCLLEYLSDTTSEAWMGLKTGRVLAHSERVGKHDFVSNACWGDLVGLPKLNLWA